VGTASAADAGAASAAGAGAGSSGLSRDVHATTSNAMNATAIDFTVIVKLRSTAGAALLQILHAKPAGGF
jgi:hypothetical protein